MRTAWRTYLLALAAAFALTLLFGYLRHEHWAVLIGQPTTKWHPPIWVYDYEVVVDILPTVLVGLVIGAIAKPFPVVAGAVFVALAAGLSGMDTPYLFPLLILDLRLPAWFLRDTILVLLGCSAGAYFRQWLA